MVSDYRLKVISSKVAELHKEFNIAEYPIKMPYIFKDFYSDKIIVKQLVINGNADVVSNYDPIHDLTVIVINKNRTSPNQLKRMNFSLAHELGHITLEHYKPYSHTRNTNIDYIEDEADEFAGQFLVPDEQVLMRPYDPEYLSKHFFVSIKVAQRRLAAVDKKYFSRKTNRNGKTLNSLLDRYLYDL